ncbi:hypothetical protein PILCRDRAFT_68594, partial [Piloderma croceum F 1598]
SVNNISIEQSWLRLHLNWGDNIVLFFYKGIEDGLYNPDDPKYELCQWLWPKLLHAALAEFMEFCNRVCMQTDKQKPGPLGMSCNEAFSIPEQWGGCNYLLLIDVNVVHEIKDAMGRDSLLEFTTPEFSAQCEAACNLLGISKLTAENVWHVFQAL